MSEPPPLAEFRVGNVDPYPHDEPDSCLMFLDVGHWPFQAAKLEVPPIYKAYCSGLCKGISQKIWPEIWYSTSILGS